MLWGGLQDRSGRLPAPPRRLATTCCGRLRRAMTAIQSHQPRTRTVTPSTGRDDLTFRLRHPTSILTRSLPNIDINGSSALAATCHRMYLRQPMPLLRPAPGRRDSMAPSLKLVVLGDSVAWGQGLLREDKYAS